MKVTIANRLSLDTSLANHPMKRMKKNQKVPPLHKLFITFVDIESEPKTKSKKAKQTEETKKRRSCKSSGS